MTCPIESKDSPFISTAYNQLMDHGHGSFYTPLVISVEEKRSHPLCSGWPDCCHLVYIGEADYVYNPDLMQKSVLQSLENT